VIIIKTFLLIPTTITLNKKMSEVEDYVKVSYFCPPNFK